MVGQAPQVLFVPAQPLPPREAVERGAQGGE
jgi:hypothetical protein